MNLEILFNASPAIQIHVYAAILAFFSGALVLWRRKGTASHKRWGKVWVALMVITALTSFFIHQIRLVGPFSPIHIISLGTLISLFLAVKQARAGDISNHQRSMKATYIGGMGIAGALAFAPGRMMYEVALAPTIDKLFSGNGGTSAFSVFDGAWQLPLLVFSVMVLVGFRKSIYRLFRSR